MKFIALFAGVCLCASSAMADQAAGAACSAKLSPDAKKIYEQVIKTGVTSSNVQSLTESTTRDLATRNQIDAGRATRSGGDAWDCAKSYLK